MAEIDVDVARWLGSEQGLELVEHATKVLEKNSDEFTISATIRTRVDDPRHANAVVAAALARYRARSQWGLADQLLFTRSGLEQASDPAVSVWRARRYEGMTTFDLGAGIGGDTAALARVASEVFAVERDLGRLQLLIHNMKAANLDVSSIGADALAVEVPPAAAIHADPGRRDHNGRRILDPRQMQPPVDALLDRYASVSGVGIVVAPGFDDTATWLPSDIEVEYVQLGDALVEATIWRGRLREPGVSASATLLPATTGLPGPETAASTPRAAMDAVTPATVDGPRHLVRRGPRPPMRPVAQIGQMLVHIAPAAIRARIHDDIAGEVGADRVARRRALFTTEHELPASPWYRARRVLTVLPARSKPIRRWLAQRDVGPIEIALHGVQLDPTKFWRELGKPPRGPQGARIELIRHDEGTVAVVTDTSG